MKYILALAFVALMSGAALAQTDDERVNACFAAADAAWAPKIELLRVYSNSLIEVRDDMLISAYADLVHHKRMCVEAETPEELRQVIEIIYAHGKAFIEAAAKDLDELRAKQETSQ